MRILVTGSRDWTDEVLIANALLEARERGPMRAGLHRMTLVHGGAKGADAIAAKWAEKWGWLIEPHPADWTAPCRDTCRPGHRRRRWDGAEYCPAAGNYRNQDMVDLSADVCLAFIKNNSNGATHCSELADAAGIQTYWWRKP
jgi:hypothetical protein